MNTIVIPFAVLSVPNQDYSASHAPDAQSLMAGLQAHAARAIAAGESPPMPPNLTERQHTLIVANLRMLGALSDDGPRLPPAAMERLVIADTTAKPSEASAAFPCGEDPHHLTVALLTPQAARDGTDVKDVVGCIAGQLARLTDPDRPSVVMGSVTVSTNPSDNSVTVLQVDPVADPAVLHEPGRSVTVMDHGEIVSAEPQHAATVPPPPSFTGPRGTLDSWAAINAHLEELARAQYGHVQDGKMITLFPPTPTTTQLMQALTAPPAPGDWKVFVVAPHYLPASVLNHPHGGIPTQGAQPFADLNEAIAAAAAHSPPPGSRLPGAYLYVVSGRVDEIAQARDANYVPSRLIPGALRVLTVVQPGNERAGALFQIPGINPSSSFWTNTPSAGTRSAPVTGDLDTSLSGGPTSTLMRDVPSDQLASADGRGTPTQVHQNMAAQTRPDAQLTITTDAGAAQRFPDIAEALMRAGFVDVGLTSKGSSANFPYTITATRINAPRR